MNQFLLQCASLRGWPRAWGAICAVCVLLFPAVASAVTGIDGHVEETQVQVADVELGAGSVLEGRLIVGDNAPLPLPRVELRDATGRTLTAEPDHHGRFVFGELNGGVYQVVVGEDVWVIRVWAEGTAPPSAAGQLMLDRRDTTVRGQYHAPPFLNSMARCIKYGATKPLVVGSVLAVAVGVPVIIHNIDQDDHS